MRLKELYVAKNLSELNKKAVLPEAVKNAKAKQIISGAEKLLQQAQREEDRDEELAYVSYMKFVESIQLALKKCNNEDKNYFTKLIGPQNVAKALGKCEKLSERLKQRYELSSMAEKSEADSLKAEKVDGGGSQNGEITNSKGSKLKPGMNGVTNGNKVTPAKPNEQPEATDEEPGDMPVGDLKNLIEQKSTTLLIIDCRGGSDFLAGHVDHPNCISIPDQILQPGLTAGKLTDSLKTLQPESYHSWNKRADIDKIILYDWSSSFDNKAVPLKTLYDAMTQWDMTTRYKAKPYVLQGGIRAVYYSYPMLMNKPRNGKLPDGEAKNSANQKILNLDAIAYPNFEDDVVKPVPPKSVPASTNSTPEQLPPRVNGEAPPPSPAKAMFDRSNKPIKRQSTPPLVNGNSAVVEPPTKEPSPPAGLNNNNSDANIEPSASNSQENLPSVSNHTTEEIKRPSPSQSPRRSLNDFAKLKIGEEKKEEVQKDSTEKEILDAGGTFIKNDIGSSSPKLLPSRPKIPDSSTKPVRSRTNTSPGAESPAVSTGTGSPHLSITKLKDESYESPRSSLLKRSHSNPNISQMSGDSQFHDGPTVITPMPSINRTLKPANKSFLGESYVRRREFDIVSSTERSETGLKNLGNTCYMNSIMQCINHTTTLVNYFLSQTYREELCRDGPTRGEITIEVASAIVEMNKGHRSIGLNSLKQAFGKFNKTFRSFDQQDSHEFLTFLLDHLHEELKKKSRRQKLPEQQNDNISDNEAAEKAWKDYLTANDSIITELFCGQQKSCVTCVACNKSSSTFESFFVLSIPIPDSRMPGKRYSLQECLDLYTAEEEISDWGCENCKLKGRAKKKIDLWRLPPTLIIHFQRFYIDSYYKKRITDIQFPVDDLNLNKLVKGRREHSYCYQLYGTSNHYGTMDSGHYTAYCRKNKNWAKFDDQEVCSIIPREVPSPAAYILFYNQLDTP